MSVLSTKMDAQLSSEHSVNFYLIRRRNIRHDDGDDNDEDHDLHMHPSQSLKSRLKVKTIYKRILEIIFCTGNIGSE
jgi:hypothetical protein